MNRRAQEEIVGFVIVMVLVSIVLLILLSLSLSNAPHTISSKDVEQFLQSSLEYTTDCALRYVPDYASTGELIDSCRQGLICIDGRSACTVLNDTLKGLIMNGLQVGADRPFEGYTLDIIYSINKSDEIVQPILNLGEGNCTGDVIEGASSVLPSSDEGLIRVSLNTCLKA